MNKKYLQYLAIFTFISVIFMIGMSVYNQHAYKVRKKGLESIQFVIVTDPIVLIGLIVTEYDTFALLRDMLIEFEPLNEQENLLHQKALKKIVRCLENVIEWKLTEIPPEKN
jgi:hypothetical protein